MTAPIAFRDAAPEDAAALAELFGLAFTETFGHLYAPDDLAAFLAGHGADRWRAELDDSYYAVRLGEADGRAVAFAKLGPPALPIEPLGPAVELRQFYVLNPWHGSGAATEMMAWVLDEAQARGAESVQLSVFIENRRAYRFYERYGFEPVGRYDFMVGSQADQDIIMRLRLGAS